MTSVKPQKSLEQEKSSHHPKKISLTWYRRAHQNTS